jgi:hypothetical protein
MDGLKNTAAATVLVSHASPPSAGRSTAKHPDSRLYDTRRSAQYLCFGYNETLKLFRSGEITAFRLKNSWRTTRECLDSWIDAKLERGA